MVLAGGSTDVDEAMRWLLQRASGGDVLIIRASGSNGYNDYLFRQLGVPGPNSVETLLLNNRALSYNADVLRKVRGAEAIFFAGGDQANYVNFYRDTPLSTALNERIRAGAVLGGTSAGCAILGQSTPTRPSAARSLPTKPWPIHTTRPLRLGRTTFSNTPC